MPSSKPRRDVGPQTIPTYVEYVPNHPLVDFSFVFRGGSSTDPVGREGRLSLTTRTLLRGTRKLTAERYEAEVDRLGAEIEVDVEADSVWVHATVVARNAERLFALLAQAFVEPRFDPEEIARQQRVGIADIVDKRNDDDDLAARAFCRVLFAGHPYGRPAYGTVRSLEHLTPDDVVTAHRDVLGSVNLAIGAAGPLDQPAVDRLVAAHFAGLHRGTRIEAFPETPRHVQGRTVLLLDKPERSRHSLLIGGLGTHVRDRDHTALLVANIVLGGMFTSRLSKEIRVRRGWSYDTHSAMSRGQSRQSFGIIAMPSSNDLRGTIRLITTLLEQWCSHGVTDREVALAKRYMVNGDAFEIDTAVKRMERRLTAASWNLPETYFTEYTQRVARVTAREASEAAHARISSDDVLYTVVATASEHRKAIERSVSKVGATYVHPYSEDIPIDGLRGWRTP